jgi:hypothetical protein
MIEVDEPPDKSQKGAPKTGLMHDGWRALSRYVQRRPRQHALHYHRKSQWLVEFNGCAAGFPSIFARAASVTVETTLATLPVMRVEASNCVGFIGDLTSIRFPRQPQRASRCSKPSDRAEMLVSDCLRQRRVAAKPVGSAARNDWVDLALSDSTFAMEI